MVADPQALAQVLQEHKVVLDPGGKKAGQAGLLGALLATAGSALVRVGITYASRELGRRFGAFPAEPVGEHHT
jgi:hypothetical protein